LELDAGVLTVPPPTLFSPLVDWREYRCHWHIVNFDLVFSAEFSTDFTKVVRDISTWNRGLRL
jgi:hypothetical protein